MNREELTELAKSLQIPIDPEVIAARFPPDLDKDKRKDDYSSFPPNCS